MMKYQEEMLVWLSRPMPQYTMRWAGTHVFLQSHRIDDVWYHPPSRTVLVQDMRTYYEFDLDYALTKYFARHTDIHNRLSAIKAMTDET